MEMRIIEKPPITWRIFKEVATVAKVACDQIIAVANQAIAARGCFRIVLSGGSTPRMTYQLLRQTQSDWPRWFIYYGDERCLPINDSERNSQMVMEAWLNHVAIKSEQVYPIAAELGPVTAAKRYAEVIAPAMPFDLVLLGMGEDGHTASLFPGHGHVSTELVNAIKLRFFTSPFEKDSTTPPFDKGGQGGILLGNDSSCEGTRMTQIPPNPPFSKGGILNLMALTELVHPVFNAPKPPPERVSLSVQALSNTQNLLFLVTGYNKREAVLAWQKGENLPINQIICPKNTEVLLDQEAGSLL